MIGILRPDFEFHSIEDIPVDIFAQHGIKGLLLDLDNTVAPWNDNTLTTEVIKWFKHIKEAGISACIVSNNQRPERVAAVADVLEILYVYKAAKPTRRAFRKGIKALGLKEEEVAVIGDQIFTDIYGGNRMGLKTILVSPIHEKEFAGTKIMRFMETLTGRKIRFSSQHPKE